MHNGVKQSRKRNAEQRNGQGRELATRYLKQEPITIEGNRARAGGADVGTGYLQFGS